MQRGKERIERFAQLVLGFGASLMMPVLVLLLLLTTGRQPLFGWGTVWQIIVMALGGAAATPIVCEFFGFLNRVFGHQAPGQSSFRADREIRRGR